MLLNIKDDKDSTGHCLGSKEMRKNETALDTAQSI